MKKTSFRALAAEPLDTSRCVSQELGVKIKNVTVRSPRGSVL